MPAPEVTSFFDPATNTISHVVRDPGSPQAAIVDPVLDYNWQSGAKGTANADRIIAFVRESRFEIEWLLETHVHADHLTAAPYLKEKLGGRIAIGDRIVDVQRTWNSVFNYKPGFESDPALFDHLFRDGETFRIGGLDARVMHTPGHTSVDVTYVLDGAAFVGDTLFMPDYGTARTDFPGGDARALWRSIQRILTLPDATRLYMCHDYLPKDGRKEFVWMTTVAEERDNVWLKGMTEDAFVARRQARDKELSVPALLYPSLQVNIRAGHMPPPEDNGVSYIKVPIGNAV